MKKKDFKVGDIVITNKARGTMYRKGEVGVVTKDRFAMPEVKFDNQVRNWMVPVEDLYTKNEYEAESTLQYQTIAFWALQLQFLEMDIRNLLSTFVSIKDSGLYIISPHTDKMNDIMDNEARFWAGNERVKPSEDDRQCLATHLALQLSGLV